MNKQKTAQKTALITGGAKRVGKNISRHLAGNGFNLAISYYSSKQEALDLKQELTDNFNVTVELLKCNLENNQDVADLAKSTLDLFADNWSLLVNNASIFQHSKMLDDDFLLQLNNNFNIHLLAPTILSHYFSNNAQKQQINNAQIINIIDKNTINYKTSYFYYLLSKKSLAELTKMSAVALAPKVRVNGISPGFIFNLEGNNKEEELRAVKSGRILTEKLPEVANILQALDFFLANTAITGQILAIDAGSGLL